MLNQPLPPYPVSPFAAAEFTPGLQSHSRPKSPFPAKAPAPPPQDLRFTAAVLGRPVKITVDAAVSVASQRLIKAKIDRAVALINLAAAKLTPQQAEILHLLRALMIPSSTQSTARTGINVFNGTFTLLDTYVLAPTVTPAFLASVLAHDSFHIWQHQHGENNYAPQAAKLEREADDFQIATGRLFGLTADQIKYLQQDTHTGYNTGRY